jgi:hypothetical protein
MNSVWKFRCLALLIIVFAGGVSMTKLLAKFLRPARALLPPNTGDARVQDQVSATTRGDRALACGI